jgi:N-acetylglucosaminyldiphosphoundecaprenol N-acetyl-beta-D-mannosaminyltransferase
MEPQKRLNRITILGIPLDDLPETELDEIVAGLEDGTNHQIILLSVWDLMRARQRVEFRTMVAGASLVIPISPSIVKAAQFLKKPLPTRYQPFEFVIKVLGALERHGKTTYLLGGTRTIVQKAEANLRSTFPGMQLVGRHMGNYPRQQEESIIEAVRKASPTLLLVGKGIPGGERWIPRKLPAFNSGIYLWCSDLFWIFAHAMVRPPQVLVDRGLEWVFSLLRRPWQLYRVFIFAAFKVLVLVERLGKHSPKEVEHQPKESN